MVEVAAPPVEEDGVHPDGGCGVDVEVGVVADVGGLVRLHLRPLQSDAEDLRVGLLVADRTGDHADVEEASDVQRAQQPLQPLLEVRDHAELHPRRVQLLERGLDVGEELVVLDRGERRIEPVEQVIREFDPQLAEQDRVDVVPEAPRSVVRRSLRTSSGAVTTTTVSNIPSRPFSTRSGTSYTTMVSVSRYGAVASANRRATSGWVIASSLRRFAGSANTTRASASRS